VAVFHAKAQRKEKPRHKALPRFAGAFFAPRFFFSLRLCVKVLFFEGEDLSEVTVEQAGHT